MFCYQSCVCIGLISVFKSLIKKVFSLQHVSVFVSAVSEGNHIKMFMRGRPITMFIPSDVENYEDVRTELPSERLKLEWVYPSVCTGALMIHYNQQQLKIKHDSSD